MFPKHKSKQATVATWLGMVVLWFLGAKTTWTLPLGYHDGEGKETAFLKQPAVRFVR